jgi:hypothetical protein
MDDQQLPLQGIIPAAVDHDPPPLADAPQSEHTLLDLAEHFIYFSPALMMQHGHFDRDPVADFITTREVPPEEGVIAVDHETPFFYGLGRGLCAGQLIDWDHRIYMIPKHRWEECQAYISSIIIKDNARRQYTVFGWYELPVVDPTTLKSGRVLERLPFIAVQMLAASSNKGFFYLEPAVDPPRTLPKVTRDGPRAEIVTQSICVLAPPEPK